MNKSVFILIFLGSVLISSLSQIILKRAASKNSKSRIAEYLNPLVIFAYFLFIGSSLLTTFAYKGVSLSLGPILETTGYIYIAILSTVLLKEKISKKKIMGNVLIIIGVIIATIF